MPQNYDIPLRKIQSQVKMPGKYDIPLNYKEGIYSINELRETSGKRLGLDYEEEWEILKYRVPGNGNEVTFYKIPEDELEKTLKASYDSNGHLKKVTAHIKEKDMLLYIYYENMEETKKGIKDFAVWNSDIIIEKICECKEKVSRLFVEYFNDGGYMDFHAKIGTEAQKDRVMEKYPDSEYAVDNCGDYPLENLYYGDNDKLKVMVLCADNDEMDYFYYAAGIMEERIGEEAPAKLDKADGFKFICSEYD